MVETIATNLVLPSIILQLLRLHECEIIVHVPIENETRTDNLFVSKVIFDLNIPLLVLDTQIDLTYEISIFGKPCITSFSGQALAKFPYNVDVKHKRPTKILLGDIYSHVLAQPNYYPMRIEYPPIVSVQEVSLSLSEYTV